MITPSLKTESHQAACRACQRHCEDEPSCPQCFSGHWHGWLAGFQVGPWHVRTCLSSRSALVAGQRAAQTPSLERTERHPPPCRLDLAQRYIHRFRLQSAPVWFQASGSKHLSLSASLTPLPPQTLASPWLVVPRPMFFHTTTDNGGFRMELHVRQTTP